MVKIYFIYIHASPKTKILWQKWLPPIIIIIIIIPSPSISQPTHRTHLLQETNFLIACTPEIFPNRRFSCHRNTPRNHQPLRREKFYPWSPKYLNVRLLKFIKPNSRGLEVWELVGQFYDCWQIILQAVDDDLSVHLTEEAVMTTG